MFSKLFRKKQEPNKVKTKTNQSIQSIQSVKSVQLNKNKDLDIDEQFKESLDKGSLNTFLLIYLNNIKKLLAEQKKVNIEYITNEEIKFEYNELINKIIKIILLGQINYTENLLYKHLYKTHLQYKKTLEEYKDSVPDFYYYLSHGTILYNLFQVPKNTVIVFLTPINRVTRLEACEYSSESSRSKFINYLKNKENRKYLFDNIFCIDKLETHKNNTTILRGDKHNFFNNAIILHEGQYYTDLKLQTDSYNKMLNIHKFVDDTYTKQFNSDLDYEKSLNGFKLSDSIKYIVKQNNNIKCIIIDCCRVLDEYGLEKTLEQKKNLSQIIYTYENFMVYYNTIMFQCFNKITSDFKVSLSQTKKMKYSNILNSSLKNKGICTIEDNNINDINKILEKYKLKISNDFNFKSIINSIIFEKRYQLMIGDNYTFLNLFSFINTKLNDIVINIRLKKEYAQEILYLLLKYIKLNDQSQNVTTSLLDSIKLELSLSYTILNNYMSPRDIYLKKNIEQLDKQLDEKKLELKDYMQSTIDFLQKYLNQDIFNLDDILNKDFNNSFNKIMEKINTLLELCNTFELYYAQNKDITYFKNTVFNQNKKPKSNNNVNILLKTKVIGLITYIYFELKQIFENESMKEYHPRFFQLMKEFKIIYLEIKIYITKNALNKENIDFFNIIKLIVSLFNRKDNIEKIIQNISLEYSLLFNEIKKYINGLNKKCIDKNELVKKFQKYNNVKFNSLKLGSKSRVGLTNALTKKNFLTNSNNEINELILDIKKQITLQ